jgi:hypothetical protein
VSTVTEPLSDDTMARLQQQVFVQLSKNKKNPVLAEMAREILAGKLTLREAASIGPYAEALFGAGHAGVSKIIEMPQEEREALVAQGVAALDQLEAQDEHDETEEPDRAHQARQADSDEFPGSIMVGAAKRRDHDAPPPQRARWTRRWQ